jgi:hypothetical protein
MTTIIVLNIVLAIPITGTITALLLRAIRQSTPVGVPTAVRDVGVVRQRVGRADGRAPATWRRREA